MLLQKRKTLASFILNINTIIAASCLLLGLFLYFFHKNSLNDMTVQLFLLFSGVIVLFFVVSYGYVALLSFPVVIAGELLNELQLPKWLHRSKWRELLFVIGCIGILWLPIITISLKKTLELGGYDITTEFIVFIFLWVTFFRVLDYAERQRPVIIAVSLKEQEENEIKFLILWIVFVFLMSLPVLFALVKFLMVGFSFEKINFTTKQEQLLLISLLGLILAFLAGWIYIKLSKRNRIAIEKLQLQNQIEQKELYINLVTEKYQTLQQYHHDFKKHLAYIQKLAQLGDTKSIENYIGSIYIDLRSSSLQKLTGEQELDILFSDKLYQAKQQNIELKIDYQPGIQLNQIATCDLSVLLGNLLDNAIEAAVNSNGRWVECEMLRKNAYLDLLIVRNSCDASPTFIDGLPVSQRGEGHGYGVKIVQRKAAQYHGDCMFYYDAEKKLFSVHILLPRER